MAKVRELFAPHESQPSGWLTDGGPPELLDGHPLLEGAVAVYAPGFEGNLLTLTPWASITNTVTRSTTVDGRSWSFAGALRSPDVPALGNFCTLAAIASTDFGTAHALLSVGASGGSDNWHALYNNGNAAASFQSRTGATIGDATAATSIRFLRSTVVGVVSSASSRAIYIDGALSGSNTTTVNVSGNDRPVLGGLWRAGSIIQQASATTTIPLGIIAARPWTADEVAMFHLEARSIFRRRNWVSFAVTASGDAAVSLPSAAATASAGTISATATASASVTLPSAAATSAVGTVAATSKPYTRINGTDAVTSQAYTILRPDSDDGVTPMPLILYCHGQNGPEHAPDSETDPNILGRAFCGAGYMIAGSAAYGNNWGNQNSINANVSLVKLLRATYPNISDVVVWGISMGGITALNVAASGRLNRIVGVYIIAGVASLQALHNGGAGAYASIIDTAYGITNTGTSTYANNTNGFDPLLRDAFTYQHRRFRFVGSTGDSTVDWDDNGLAMAAMLAGTCAEVGTVTTTGGHISSSHYDAADALAFMGRCFDTPVALKRPATSRTVSVTLKDAGGTARANLTGLRVAWFDQPLVSGLEYPTARYTGATTDASGVLSITSVPSDLAVSGVGLMLITDSDGSTTQSPVHKIAGAPVAVS